MVQVSLTLTTTSPLTRCRVTHHRVLLTAHSRVRVSVAAVPPVTVSRPTLTFASLTGTDTLQVGCYLVLSGAELSDYNSSPPCSSTPSWPTPASWPASSWASWSPTSTPRSAAAGDYEMSVSITPLCPGRAALCAEDSPAAPVPRDQTLSAHQGRGLQGRVLLLYYSKGKRGVSKYRS